MPWRGARDRDGTPAPAPAQDATWNGLVVAPEARCSAYDSDDYRYSQAVEDRIVRSLGGVYGPYTGRWFRSKDKTDIEHIVARSEAHDSGLCRADRATLSRFSEDLRNLTLAAPGVNRHQKRVPRRGRLAVADEPPGRLKDRARTPEGRSQSESSECVRTAYSQASRNGVPKVGQRLARSRKSLKQNKLRTPRAFQGTAVRARLRPIGMERPRPRKPRGNGSLRPRPLPDHHPVPARGRADDLVRRDRPGALRGESERRHHPQPAQTPKHLTERPSRSRTSRGRTSTARARPSTSRSPSSTTARYSDVSRSSPTPSHAGTSKASRSASSKTGGRWPGTSTSTA